VSGRHPGGTQDGSALRPGPKPVAIIIPLRTLVLVAVFAGFVALAVLSAGTLLSIFVAVFAIVLVTAGPLWDQITDFVQQLPAYWDQLTATDGFQQLISTGGAFGSILSLVALSFLAVPFAATIKIIIREAGSPRRARMAELREVGEGEPLRVP
jgi:predicted PurR-regulated permease PerM